MEDYKNEAKALNDRELMEQIYCMLRKMQEPVLIKMSAEELAKNIEDFRYTCMGKVKAGS